MADITDPHAPFIIDSKRDTTNLSDPRGVAISGGYIFIASGNIFDVFTTVETSLASDCSATITVSGGTQQPTATVDSVLNSAGNATISGTATGPTSLTVIIYPSFDSDTVVYRDDQVPVSGGHWSVTAPLQSGSYTVEVHKPKPFSRNVSDQQYVLGVVWSDNQRVNRTGSGGFSLRQRGSQKPLCLCLFALANDFRTIDWVKEYPIPEITLKQISTCGQDPSTPGRQLAVQLHLDLNSSFAPLKSRRTPCGFSSKTQKMLTRSSNPARKRPTLTLGNQ